MRLIGPVMGRGLFGKSSGSGLTGVVGTVRARRRVLASQRVPCAQGVL